MDGLPVRQWRKQPALVNTAPPKEAQPEAIKDTIWKELPMPRGSEHYPPHVQALLRAARAGRILQSAPKPTEDEKEGGEDEDSGGEPYSGFVVTKWLQVSREMEQPEPEYLAKRRKGLPTLYGVAGNIPPPTLRKTKVKKIDNDGNLYFLDVLVPEGTFIEGEVAEGETAPTQAPAPGTVVEGVGVANAEGIVVAGDPVAPTPPRRRPPPPKRKPKGPGRGRKKKVVVENGADGVPTAVNANSAQSGTIDPLTGKPSVSGDANGASVGANGAGDDSMLQDGDEGSDEDDEEGEEGELTDTEDQLSRSVTPSKPSTTTRIKSPVKTTEDGLLAPPLHSTESSLPTPATLPTPEIAVHPSTESDVAGVDAAGLSTPDILQPIATLPADIAPTEPVGGDVVMNDAAPTETPPDIQIAGDSIRTDLPIESATQGDLLPTTPAPEPMPAGISDLPTEPTGASLLPGLGGVEEAAAPITEVESSAAPATETPIPPLDAAEEPALAVPTFESTEPVAVEEAKTQLEAPVGATIPEEHNPLEGLSEPKADQQVVEEPLSAATATVVDSTAEESKGEPEASVAPEPTEANSGSDLDTTAKAPAQSGGAEDDIFGSLERHLDSKSG